MGVRCPRCDSENADTSRFCGSCATPLKKGETAQASQTKTLETPVRELIAGAIIAGKYKIIEEIGRGGMGIVYKAEDIKLQRTIALKFLPQQWISDADARARFIHEARAASALDHNNICTIYEIAETEDGRRYIAMAFYEGESLRDKIKRSPLPTEEALKISVQAAEGMLKAHQKGIVHRDIKPANILITGDGVAKIVDFGLAKLAGQVRLTREGTTMGTVAYMSPEQARGEAVDERTDIWSLGVVLYEMLSGVLPFRGDYDQTLIHSILHHEPDRLAKLRKDLPSGLENIVFKALGKKPSDRYQSMAEMVEDLRAIIEGLAPVRGASLFFRGRVLGLKKVYAYPAMAGIIILATLASLFIFPKRGQAYDSIAVLPLENPSRDAQLDVFSDGLAIELISRFYRIGSLRVAAFREVKGYKNSSKSYQEIGRELNVKAVLNAAVQSDGKRIKITPQLIDASTGRAIWAPPPYERDTDDIEALQAEVVEGVVPWFGVKLTPQDQARLTASKTVSKKVDPKAQEAYFSGVTLLREVLEAPTPERWRASYRFLQKAIEIEPTYALPYFLLVGYHIAGRLYAYSSLEEAIANAEEAIKKGLALDRDSFEAHLASARLKMMKWEFRAALDDFRLAVELAPGDPDARSDYSSTLGALDRWDEAIVEAKRLIEKNPDLPFYRANLGNAYWNARRFDEAISVLNEVLPMDPANPLIHMWLALSYAVKNMPDKAEEEAKKTLQLLPSSDMNVYHLQISMAYAYLGRKDDSQKILNQYLELRKYKPVDAYTVGSVYSVLGEKEKAFEWLERAYRRHDWLMYWLKVDPPWDNIRSDPRYKEYLKKVGFEK